MESSCYKIQNETKRNATFGGEENFEHIYIYNVFFQVYNLSTNSKNNLVRHKVMSMEHSMIIKVTIIKGKFAYHCF